MYISENEVRKRAIRILANLVHYQNGKSHLGDDIETVINELRRFEEMVDANRIREEK